MIAEEYITAAVARSYANRGDVLAPAVDELLDRLSRQFRSYYTQAAEAESARFAQLALLSFQATPTPHWALPADVDTVHSIEQNDAQIYVVPYEDRRGAEPSEACLYQLGNDLYPVGNATDPSQIALQILYTPVPPDFTTVADPAPTTWNTNFDGLVVAELALYLAEKDGRTNDMQAMMAALEDPRVGWRAAYTSWLGRMIVPSIRRFGSPRAVPSAVVVSAGVKKNS